MTLSNSAVMVPGNTQITWSGNVWAQSQCTTTGGVVTCKTAKCHGSEDCTTTPNKAPLGPVTLAEFTLQNNAQDFYDVSAINGVNLPVMMSPTPTSGLTSVIAPPLPTPQAQYWCGAPGSNQAIAGLKAADWNVGAHAPTGVGPIVAPAYYRYVDTAGHGQSCSGVGDPACTSGSVCGLAFQGTALQCGSLIGWWTAEAICSANPTLNFGGIHCGADSEVLLCNKQKSSSCSGIYCNSCYSTPPSSTNCCGCENWPGVTTRESCPTSNGRWVADSLPWLQPLKAAVPTAYSYPFDDPTSTFNCYQVPTAKVNVPLPQSANGTNYTITFCPGGINIPTMH